MSDVRSATAPAPAAASAVALSAQQSAILERVLDLIVPPSADGRLPGAAQVGVPAWLIARAPDALAQLADELDTLQAQARERHGQDFAALAAPLHQALVDALRARDPAFLARLALETVTCYYQDDRVLEALGLETRPPAPQGFQVIAGDLTLLAPVRRRGKRYRDA